MLLFFARNNIVSGKVVVFVAVVVDVVGNDFLSALAVIVVD